jgi:6-phosphofructokinase 1
MDNDVFGTDYCIGFSTAVTRSVEFITNMRTSVGSHERIGGVELFGRNSGETSLISAYLSYVDQAIISEVPFDINRLAHFLEEDKRSNPSIYAIMTISEGAIMEGGEIVESGEADAYGHRKLGGVGELAAAEIKRITGRISCTKMGYLCGPARLIHWIEWWLCHTATGCSVDSPQRNRKMVAFHGGKYATVR